MKTYRILILIALLYGCKLNQKKENESDEVRINKSKLRELNNRLIFINHDISFKTFIDLSQDFIDNYKNESTQKTFGGFLNLASMTPIQEPELGKNAGLAFYYCLKANDSGEIDSLFIAYRTIYNYDVSNPNFVLDDNASLYRSNLHFVYNKAAYTFAADSAFLIGFSDARVEMNSTISGKDVKKYNVNFKNYFKDENKYCYGFFLEQELDSLLNKQGPKTVGARFILGRDYTANVNKIKLSLFAVDDLGKNLLYNEHTKKYYLMFERSWPPGGN